MDNLTSNNRLWVQRAYRAIREVAQKQETVHVNDIWAIAERDGWPEPTDRRVLSGAFTRAAQDGLITMSDTAIRVRHNGGHFWRPVWISQIHPNTQRKATTAV